MTEVAIPVMIVESTLNLVHQLHYLDIGEKSMAMGRDEIALLAVQHSAQCSFRHRPCSHGVFEGSVALYARIMDDLMFNTNAEERLTV